MKTTPKGTPLVPRRLPALDLARAIAIYFMMIINFKLIFHHDQGYYPWLTDLAEHLDGRAAATFVVLAGIGVACFYRKNNDTRRVSSALVKRSAFLFCTGWIFTLTWPCDILHVYAAFLIAGAFMMSFSGRRILLIFALLWTLFIGILGASDYNLLWKNTGLPVYEITSLTIFVKHYLFNGTYPLIPWLIFFVAGLGIGRRYIHIMQNNNRLILFGFLMTAVAEAAAGLLIKFNAAKYFSFSLENTAIVNDTIRNPMLHWFTIHAFPPTPLFVVSALGTALVVIGMARWAVQHWPESKFIDILVNTGQLSLTIYVGHVLLGINTMELLGINGDQHIVFVIACASLAFLCAMLVAHYLKMHFRKGPLEWLMRKTADLSLQHRRIHFIPENVAAVGNLFCQETEVPVKTDAGPLPVTAIPKTTGAKP